MTETKSPKPKKTKAKKASKMVEDPFRFISKMKSADEKSSPGKTTKEAQSLFVKYTFYVERAMVDDLKKYCYWNRKPLTFVISEVINDFLSKQTLKAIPEEARRAKGILTYRPT